MSIGQIRKAIFSTQSRKASTIILLALLALVAAAAHPPAIFAQDDNPPLRVVIKPLVPFVIVEGDTYRGFSIDLWEEIARRLGRQYEYQLVETVKDQLETVEQNRADLAITGISITREREEVMDFSLPYFKAGLQIMTSADASGTWTPPGQMLLLLLDSPSFWRIIGVLTALILIMGHVFWLLERRRNPDFPQSYLRGVWEGIWYTVVTLVTVGYGDRTARTVPGRLFAMGWMFLSLLLVASFTANITSQLTLNQFQGLIRGEDDLPGKRIATVANSTAAQYLERRAIRYRGVDLIEEAYDLLERGQVDAIVYDSPVLMYYSNTEGQGRVQVVGDIFQPQDYGIALPSGSPERENINRALLEVIEDGAYTRIFDRWYNTTTSSN